MKKILLTIAMILGLGATSAHAQTAVTINIDRFFDWGRTYSHAGTTYTTTNSNPAYFGPGSDTPVPTNITENTVGNADGKEDSWGVGSIASITGIVDPSQVFFQRSAGNALNFMFQGFDDDFLSAPTVLGATQILSTGGHIQVWANSNDTFNGTGGTADRTGQDTYLGVTEGILVLDLVPVAIDGFGHTLESNFNFLTQTGSGALYLATTGAGTWDSIYNTNAQLFGADFSLSFTVRDNTNPTVGNWEFRGDAGGEGAVIPEPTSMMLLGSGLVGMVGRLRRKKA